MPDEQIECAMVSDDFDPEPMHSWFELSYAQYLTIPRFILQAMPQEWQAKFAELLTKLDRSIDWRPKNGRYWVALKDNKGRYIHDPFMQYRHNYEPIPWMQQDRSDDKDGG